MNPKDLARQEKLEKLQDRHGILTAQKKGHLRIIRDEQAEIGVINKELDSIGQAIYDLKNIDGDTPHITDHAIVRYLERYEGLNVWDVKSKIMQHSNKVRIDNTIVTVNSEEIS